MTVTAHELTREVPLVPAQSALLFIDVQNFCAHPGGGEFAGLSATEMAENYGYFFDRLRGSVLPNMQRLQAAFRTAKDSASQTEAAGGSQWVVFRVTDINTPAVDIASDDVKKLKDALQQGLNQEQSAQYVARLEKDIGTTINEAAVAQVVGSNQ